MMISKTFEEVAKEHLKETYNLEDFQFREGDPLGIRAEFIEAIDLSQSMAYLWDDKVSEILLTGISGFEEALETPEQVVQILLAPSILNKGQPHENLPDLIPPFSTNLFPHKDAGFVVSMGDLIEETDDTDWEEEFDDNYALWMAKRTNLMVDQLWPIVLTLEAEYPGITINLMKSCFVSSFYEVERSKSTGEFILDDQWDIFGWTLDLWQDYAKENTPKTEAEIIKVSSEKDKDPKEDWDYNEEYFNNVE